MSKTDNVKGYNDNKKINWYIPTLINFHANPYFIRFFI